MSIITIPTSWTHGTESKVDRSLSPVLPRPAATATATASYSDHAPRSSLVARRSPRRFHLHLHPPPISLVSSLLPLLSSITSLSPRHLNLISTSSHLIPSHLVLDYPRPRPRPRPSSFDGPARKRSDEELHGSLPLPARPSFERCQTIDKSFVRC